MATATLEERVEKLEEKVTRLLEKKDDAKQEIPWWKKIVGIYKDDPEFDEAMRLGREYRESLRPQDDEDAP